MHSYKNNQKIAITSIWKYNETVHSMRVLNEANVGSNAEFDYEKTQRKAQNFWILNIPSSQASCREEIVNTGSDEHVQGSKGTEASYFNKIWRKRKLTGENEKKKKTLKENKRKHRLKKKRSIREANLFQQDLKKKKKKKKKRN